MRTLHPGVRVTHIDGSLTMLKLPGGDHGPQTSWAVDPDGYRVELTQWPVGHSVGLSSVDFPA